MGNTILLTIITFIISFIITAVSEHFLIPELHKLNFGQYIREEGPESHKKKAGTPTMGGICILGSVIISALIAAAVIAGTGLFSTTYGITASSYGMKSEGILSYGREFAHQFILVIILMTGYGIVGLTDDLLKLKKKDSEGLTPSGKMLFQMAVTAVFIVLYFIFEGERGNMNGMKVSSIWIPFIRHPVTMPVVLFIIFLLFVLLGTDNGTNLTDGLDGLLSFVTLPVCIVIGIMSQDSRCTDFTKAPSAVLIISAAMLGALCGFLVYNHHPAKVFMGDTGSLAIGGYVAASAVVLHAELYIILFGFVYLAETVSDIMQVSYYKLTNGKRIFKMAPIHHHFEKCGWKETKVVTVFSVTSVIFCIISYLLF